MFAVIACVLVLRVLACIPPTKIHICGSLFECASAHCIGKLMSGELRQEKIPLICCSKHPEGSRHVESNAKKKNKKKGLRFHSESQSPLVFQRPSRRRTSKKDDKLSHPLAKQERRQIVTLLGGQRRETNCRTSWRDAKRGQIVTFPGSSSVLSETA